MHSGSLHSSTYRKKQSVEENGHIHKKGAIPDVVEVVLDVFVNGERSIGTELPQACNPWHDLKPSPLLCPTAFRNQRHVGPRLSQRHVSKKDIDQQRYLIQCT